jgi:hypothetical protein
VYVSLAKKRQTSFRKFLVGDLLVSYNCLNTIFSTASTLSVFKPGSTSPSAILFDAWQNFVDKSPKADESIRSIRPELAKAVDECIDAAGQEWEPSWQRRLLNVWFIFPFIFLEVSRTLQLVSRLQSSGVGS